MPILCIKNAEEFIVDLRVIRTPWLKQERIVLPTVLSVNPILALRPLASTW